MLEAFLMLIWLLLILVYNSVPGSARTPKPPKRPTFKTVRCHKTGRIMYIPLDI